MRFPDIVDDLKARAPRLRGRLVANAPIAETTWFRVGGPAQALFSPADEDDLAYFLSVLPRETPVTTIGLGSNLIVRDGGVAGVVIRLGGRAFGAIEIAGRLPPRRGGGRAGPVRRQGRRKGGGGRAGLLTRRAGFDRRRAAHERRRPWRRDQGRADRSAWRRPRRREARVFERGHGLFLSGEFGAGGRRLHRRGVSGPPGRAGRDRSRDGANHPRARGLAADPGEDRRLDVQESARARRPGS